MTTPSPWALETERPPFPRLEASLEVDVAIIGGGIAGIMTAYELTKAGKREQGIVGRELEVWADRRVGPRRS